MLDFMKMTENNNTEFLMAEVARLEQENFEKDRIISCVSQLIGTLVEVMECSTLRYDSEGNSIEDTFNIDYANTILALIEKSTAIKTPC